MLETLPTLRGNNEDNLMILRLITLVLLSFAPLFSACAVVGIVYQHPVTFRVVDSEGVPVENAGVYAFLPSGKPAMGKTDKEGKITLFVHPEATLNIAVQKENYYATSGEIFRGGLHNNGKGGLESRKVLSEYTVVLKEIRNPVPMVQEFLQVEIPYDGSPIHYDMEKKDMVAPMGKGTKTHIIFKMKEFIFDEDIVSGTLEISFPNPDDGLQPFIACRPLTGTYGSTQAPPHQAPLDGYQPTFEIKYWQKKGEPYYSTTVKDRNFIFRTLTEKDASGRIIAANHGWLMEDPDFGVRINSPLWTNYTHPRTFFVQVAYMFNPDRDMQTRSLEYDHYADYSRRTLVTEQQVKEAPPRPAREIR